MITIMTITKSAIIMMTVVENYISNKNHQNLEVKTANFFFKRNIISSNTIWTNSARRFETPWPPWHNPQNNSSTAAKPQKQPLPTSGASIAVLTVTYMLCRLSFELLAVELPGKKEGFERGILLVSGSCFEWYQFVYFCREKKKNDTFFCPFDSLPLHKWFILVS